MVTTRKTRNPVIVAALVASLLVVPHVASRDEATPGFDPFAAPGGDEIALTGLAAEEGPTIPEIEFNSDEISMAFQIISDATGWSIFPTADVSKARISLWAKSISARQLLDMVVTMAGFVHYRQGTVVTVMTYDEYTQYYGLAKEVLPLKRASAETVAEVVRPFLTKVGKTGVDKRTNAVILLDSEANAKTIIGVIEKLDGPEDAEFVLEVVDLQYSDSMELAEMLQRVFAESEVPSSQPRKAVVSAQTPGKEGDRITATQAAPEARFSSPRSRVGAYSLDRTNQLILRAFQGDIEKLKQLVEELDTFVEPMTRNYHFTYVDASAIFTGLERILDLPMRGGTSGRSQGQGRRESGRPSGVTLVEKTNSILLTAPPSVHRVMTSIVESVDVAATYETGIIRIYKIENADVDEVAKAIRDLLERRERRDEERPGEPKFKSEAAEAPPETADQKQVSETEEFIPQIEARVAVSKATNSVIVQATARQHRELEKLVKELDKRRRQVLIESKIVEVRTQDGLDLGVELSHATEDEGLAFTHFGLSSGLDPITGTRNVIVGPGGAAAILRPERVQVILKALDSNQDVKVTSAPRILVNDNAAGFINSIAEEPYTQLNLGQVTATESFGGFVEAGTQFMITPHISESGYLRVEYQITLNSFGDKPTETSIPPPRNTSSIRSEATVPDGYTIIVGGLQTSSEQTTVDKVPLLGDIPLLGLAFRNTSIKKAYSTTYLFITPVIMEQEDFSDLKDVSRQTQQEMEENDPTKKTRSRTKRDRQERPSE